MKIGIIGAMEEEIQALVGKMEKVQTWEEAGAIFYAGIISDHEVVVVRSGIGKVLAAVTATLLISHYQVDCLINTGSAGGIGSGLQIGDLVVSTKLAYFDADVTAFGYEMGQMAGMPLYYVANEQLLQQTIKVAKEEQFSIVQGLIVSGDSFINSQKKTQEIKDIFPEVVANEMEGAAIAQVAFQYQVPFVVIRAISDTADEEANVTFDVFIQEAGKKSATLVLSLLKQLTEWT